MARLTISSQGDNSYSIQLDGREIAGELVDLTLRLVAGEPPCLIVALEPDAIDVALSGVETQEPE